MGAGRQGHRGALHRRRAVIGQGKVARDRRAAIVIHHGLEQRQLCRRAAVGEGAGHVAIAGHRKGAAGRADIAQPARACAGAAQIRQRVIAGIVGRKPRHRRFGDRIAAGRNRGAAAAAQAARGRTGIAQRPVRRRRQINRGRAILNRFHQRQRRGLQRIGHGAVHRRARRHRDRADRDTAAIGDAGRAGGRRPAGAGQGDIIAKGVAGQLFGQAVAAGRHDNAERAGAGAGRRLRHAATIGHAHRPGIRVRHADPGGGRNRFRQVDAPGIQTVGKGAGGVLPRAQRDAGAGKRAARTGQARRIGQVGRQAGRGFRQAVGADRQHDAGHRGGAADAAAGIAAAAIAQVEIRGRPGIGAGIAVVLHGLGQGQPRGAGRIGHGAGDIGILRDGHAAQRDDRPAGDRGRGRGEGAAGAGHRHVIGQTVARQLFGDAVAARAQFRRQRRGAGAGGRARGRGTVRIAQAPAVRGRHRQPGRRIHHLAERQVPLRGIGGHAIDDLVIGQRPAIDRIGRAARVEAADRAGGGRTGDIVKLPAGRRHHFVNGQILGRVIAGAVEQRPVDIERLHRRGEIAAPRRRRGIQHNRRGAQIGGVEGKAARGALRQLLKPQQRAIGHFERPAIDHAALAAGARHRRGGGVHRIGAGRVAQNQRRIQRSDGLPADRTGQHEGRGAIDRRAAILDVGAIAMAVQITEIAAGGTVEAVRRQHILRGRIVKPQPQVIARAGIVVGEGDVARHRIGIARRGADIRHGHRIQRDRHVASDTARRGGQGIGRRDLCSARPGQRQEPDRRKGLQQHCLEHVAEPTGLGRLANGHCNRTRTRHGGNPQRIFSPSPPAGPRKVSGKSEALHAGGNAAQSRSNLGENVPKRYFYVSFCLQVATNAAKSRNWPDS